MSNPIQAQDLHLDTRMQYDKKIKKVKFSNMRFISCLDTGIGSASLAASYSSAEKLQQICSVLCRSSKYMLIQKFLLNKNICFSFLSLESKVISLLPYGTAGRGRVKRKVERQGL